MSSYYFPPELLHASSSSSPAALPPPAPLVSAPGVYAEEDSGGFLHPINSYKIRLNDNIHNNNNNNCPSYLSLAILWRHPPNDVLKLGKSIGDRPFLLSCNHEHSVYALYKPAGYECSSATLRTRIDVFDFQGFTRTFLRQFCPSADAAICLDSTVPGVCGLGMAHRLDKETSGVLMCYASPLAGDLLVKSRPTWDKFYVCIAHIPGATLSGVRVFDQRIDVSGRKSVVSPSGKPCRTTYSLISSFELYGVKLGLFKIKLQGGLTHQIRCHFSHGGYPLFMDKIYGKSSDSKLGCSLTRHALHCTHMEITTGILSGFTATCPLPDDFISLLRESSNLTSVSDSDFTELLNLGRDAVIPALNVSIRHNIQLSNDLVVVTGGFRFSSIHDHLRSLADHVINVRVADPASTTYRGSTGLNHSCRAFVMNLIHKSDLYDGIISAAKNSNILYVHCRSGRHRSVAVAEHLKTCHELSHRNVIVLHATLALAVAGTARDKQVIAAIDNFSNYCGLLNLAVDNNKMTFVPGFRSLSTALVEADLLEDYLFNSNYDMDSNLCSVDAIIKSGGKGSHNFIPNDSLASELVNLLSLGGNQGLFDLDSYVTVAGDSLSQARHLAYFCHSDYSVPSDFSFIEQSIDRVLCGIPNGSLECLEDLPLNSLVTDSSAGEFYRKINPLFMQKGDCLPEIAYVAGAKLEAIMSGKPVIPGIQTIAGRGKRISRKKRTSLLSTDAVGRMIRVGSADDILICELLYIPLASCLDKIPNVFVGKSMTDGNFNKFLKHLDCITFFGRLRDNVLYIGPDAIKMDSSVRSGLTHLVLSKLFKKFKSTYKSRDISPLLKYVIDVHTSARCRLNNNQLLLINTGLSSGNVFVSLIESIIMAALDDYARSTLDSRQFYGGSCSTMGDDLIASLRTYLTINHEVIDYVFDVYNKVACSLCLSFHPIADKGFLTSVMNSTSFCSRKYLSLHISVRDIDDTLGALLSPEYPTTSPFHLLLRIVGLIYDNPCSVATEVLLLLIPMCRTVLLTKIDDTSRDDRHLATMLRRDSQHIYNLRVIADTLGVDGILEAMYSMDPNQYLLRVLMMQAGCSSVSLLSGRIKDGLAANTIVSSYLTMSTASCLAHQFVQRLNDLGITISPHELFAGLQYADPSRVEPPDRHVLELLSGRADT